MSQQPNLSQALKLEGCSPSACLSQPHRGRWRAGIITAGNIPCSSSHTERSTASPHEHRRSQVTCSGQHVPKWCVYVPDESVYEPAGNSQSLLSSYTFRCQKLHRPRSRHEDEREQRPLGAHERHTGAVGFGELPVIIVHLGASGLKHTGREDVFTAENSRDSPGGPVVKNPPCHAGEKGSVPGWRTKIPQASGQLSPSAATTKAHTRHN